MSGYGRGIGAAVVMAIGLPACSDCRAPPPAQATTTPSALVTASSAPPMLSASAATMPVASSAGAPWPAHLAADAPEDGCDVTVQYDVTRENIAGWVALWKKLSSEAPVERYESEPGEPTNAASIRDLLGVKACNPACVVTWPRSSQAKAAYVIVPLPNHTIDRYGPVLENELGGQCSGQVVGTIEGERPVHADVIVEEASSERLCRTDAGELVEWEEGMEECMSSCVTRSYREVDFFLGPSGSTALIERRGSRGRGDAREHVASIQRKGDALIVRGVNGCTRWIDLRLSPRARP